MADAPALVEELSLEQLPDAPPDFNPCEGGDALVSARSLISPRQYLVTWLPAAFDKWDAKYRLITGWQDRGRPPSSGGFNPQGRVLVHHTGSTSSTTNPHPALGTVTKGRPDLTGPLCQISTDHNGVTSIVAAGRANHAGKAKAVGSAPAGDGNALWIGNEVDTSGLQTMPQAQYDAVVLTCCAIFDHEGIKPAQVGDYLALHHTTSLSGKWDLGAGNGRSGIPYPVRDLRADVAVRLAAGPPSSTNPTAPAAQEDDMSDITVKNPRTGKEWPIEGALWSMWTYILDARDDAAAARALAEAQALKGAALTADEVKAIVDTALDEKIEDGTGTVVLNAKPEAQA